MTPIWDGFEPGKFYEQVDLGSRAAVEGLASALTQKFADRRVTVPVATIANQIEWVNSLMPGEYVVFTGKDHFEDEIARVYQRVD